MLYMLMKEKKSFMLKFVGVFLSCFFVGVNVAAAATSFRESQRFSRVFPGLYNFSNENAVDVGDFDQDGRADLIYRKDVDLFALRFGVGDGTFTAEKSVSMSTSGTSLGLVVAGDFAGSDGKLDLVRNSFSRIEVGLGDGNGGFRILPWLPASAAGLVVVGDVTGDGRPDVVRANFNSGSVSVFDGDGTGRLAAERSIGVGSAPAGLALADVDQDGDLDCVVTQPEENAVLVLANDGRGRFTRSAKLEVGESPQPVAVTDGDGLLDIVVGNADEASLSVLIGRGDGTFQAHQEILTHGNPVSLKMADFNNDHKPDLIVQLLGAYSGASPTLSMLLNTSSVVGSSPENPQPQPPVDQPKSPVVSECVVPKVTGLSLVAARKKLIAAGCTIGKITTKKRSARAVRQLKRKKFSLVVVSQSVKPGVKIAKTTPVALRRDFRKVKKAKKK